MLCAYPYPYPYPMHVALSVLTCIFVFLALKIKAAARTLQSNHESNHGSKNLYIFLALLYTRKLYINLQGRSQPNIPQRIWGSSDLSTNLSRSRSLSSSNRNRPGSSMRPLPTIYSRPESRAADSRPQSRIEPRDQDKALDVRGNFPKTNI